MKIMGIDKEAVKEAAARAFPRKHTPVSYTHLVHDLSETADVAG